MGYTSATGADGIHADYKSTITGGTVNIDSAYEGLEANIITVTGGFFEIRYLDNVVI